MTDSPAHALSAGGELPAARALRLQAVTLAFPDLTAAGEFYRWTFRLDPIEREASEDVRVLGWGREDRLRLVSMESAAGPAEAGGPGASGGTNAEAIRLRLTAMPLEDAVRWCAERGVEPLTATVTKEDAERARRLLAGVPVAIVEDPPFQNLNLLTVRAWGDQPLELFVPLPRELVAQRKQLGPFRWPSDDWTGLETPGLLGVTWAGPDIAAGRAFCERLGIAPFEEGAGVPHLRIGDHQLILEERDRPGIAGVALVVPRAKLGEVERTLRHLGAELKSAGNRLLTRDPGGHVVFVQGVNIG